MKNNLSEPELQLPDLEMMVKMAIPMKPADCHLIRGQKENQRQRLTVQIREYAELYHLERLREKPLRNPLMEEIRAHITPEIKAEFDDRFNKIYPEAENDPFDDYFKGKITLDEFKSLFNKVVSNTK